MNIAGDNHIVKELPGDGVVFDSELLIVVDKNIKIVAAGKEYKIHTAGQFLLALEHTETLGIEFYSVIGNQTLVEMVTENHSVARYGFDFYAYFVARCPKRQAQCAKYQHY